MHEKIRTVTLKNVIIAVWWIVISLAVSLHCSDEALAAELLPAVSAEEGAEDTLQEQTAAPAESAGQQERPEASEAVQHASVKDGAAEENTGASDTTAPAAEEADMTAAAVEEGDMTTAAAVTVEGDAARAAREDTTAINSDADHAADAAEVADAADAGTSDSSDQNEDLGGERSEDQSGDQNEGLAGDQNEDQNGEKSPENTSLRTLDTVDPLSYLLECLQYHGNEKDSSAYSLRAYTEDGQSIVTPVKNQSPWETCWGFAAIASSECSILSECYAKWDQLAPGLLEKYSIRTFKELCEWLDLSERQIAWFTFMKEPENGNYPSQAGEGTIAIRPGMDGIYNAGGFNSYATSVFARGTGPLEESRVPYQNNEGVLNEGVKVTAKDGTEYLAQDYVSTKMETREVEYECLIPSTMTKEEVLEIFEFYPDLKEKLIKRLEEGVITKVESVARYVDDNGKYYSVVRKNELKGLDGFPEILIYEDEDGVRYEFDPATKTFPGLPELHIAEYDWSVDESLHYASLIGLENSNIMPKYYVDFEYINEDAIKAIKDELRAGRGVSISFCADASRPGETGRAKYINNANNVWAHYTDRDTAESNHSVTIVGYNDNFPKTLFLEGHQPPKDGAWLVKNSWGGGRSTGTDFANWGIDENGDGIGDGYFWISYWDYTIQDVETFDYRVEDLVTDRMEYDIRQHDLISTNTSVTYPADMEANVFTAEATENIHEIGVQHSHSDTTVSYEIYLLNENAADPTDGVLLASGSEYFKYAGYHRIKTDKVCIVPAGLKYSVVVKQMTGDKAYVSVLYDVNEQYAEDHKSMGAIHYSHAVVNRGESYVLNKGTWMDWVDFIPGFLSEMKDRYRIARTEWYGVDNPSIKVYADFIGQDLQAEAAEIGTTDASATVGVSDEETAEQDALVSLALVHNEISNNVPAASADSVAKGYISAGDYDAVVKTLIDPSSETGLKVVVSTKEISASDIEADGLEKLLNAAKDKIARYADISLLIMTLDTGEYVGRLHKTDNPIGLAMEIPSDLAASGNPVYVLRLHDGVVESLPTTVQDGRACFASDLFSKFALAYDMNEPAEKPVPDQTIVPGKPENTEPAKEEAAKADTKTSAKKSAGKTAKTAKTGKAAAGRAASPKTGDDARTDLWLALTVLAAAAAMAAALRNNRKLTARKR